MTEEELLELAMKDFIDNPNVDCVIALTSDEDVAELKRIYSRGADDSE